MTMNTVQKFITITIMRVIGENNMNRDETGSPKHVSKGGELYQSASSQSLKYAVRMGLGKHCERSTRSRLHAYDAYNSMIEGGVEHEAAVNAAKKINISIYSNKQYKSAETLKLKKSDLEPATVKDAIQGEAVVALSSNEMSNIQSIVDAMISNEEIDIYVRITDGTSHDVAAFGSMTASASELSVYAAMHVSQLTALSPMETQFDYFTATDDLTTEGSAHLDENTYAQGNVFVNTFQIDPQLFRTNINGTQSREILDELLEAMVMSIPQGKINTYANGSLPAYIRIEAISDAPALPREVFLGSDHNTVTSAVNEFEQKRKQLIKVYGFDVESVTLNLESDSSATLADLKEFFFDKMV